MKKQLFVGLAALSAVLLFFFFGRTTASKKAPAASATVFANNANSFKVDRYTDSLLGTFSPNSKKVFDKLNADLQSTTNPADKVKFYTALAEFWKDSAHFEPYAFNVSQAAKLDNSEKSLNFAAQIFLDHLRSEPNVTKLEWETASAIELFEKSLELNPKSVDARLGLGASYIFGKANSNNPQATMQGIQQLLSVVREDSTNMKAQMLLGIGGAVSGQYDKAIERLQKVVDAQPDNLEAISFLADAYAAAGKKAEAIKWYNITKRLIKDPHYTEEVEKRIKSLQ